MKDEKLKALLIQARDRSNPDPRILSRILNVLSQSENTVTNDTQPVLISTEGMQPRVSSWSVFTQLKVSVLAVVLVIAIVFGLSLPGGVEIIPEVYAMEVDLSNIDMEMGTEDMTHEMELEMLVIEFNLSESLLEI